MGFFIEPHSKKYIEYEYSLLEILTIL